MRVNVYIESISKTLMNGLKVFSKFNKSNKRKSLEYYLKFSRIIKQTLATLLTSSTLKLAVATIASALIVLIEIFLNIIDFCRLTVLMNDFRLKTFYYKLTKQSTTSKTTLTFLSTSSITSVSSSALSITSSKNNHNRTYNNSSKSNKVFLYYTPRDPRLRIFLKTKHFFNRPTSSSKQSQLINLSFSSKKVFRNNNNNSLLKVTDDLCNYGELIGGGVYNCNSNNNSNCSDYINCGVKTTKLIVIENINSVNSLNNKTTIICDNLTKTSDNCVVAATTSAAAVNNIVNIIIIAIAIKYIEELFSFIGILLSLNNYQQLKVLNVKTKFGLYENIL